MQEKFGSYIYDAQSKTPVKKKKKKGKSSEKFQGPIPNKHQMTKGLKEMKPEKEKSKYPMKKAHQNRPSLPSCKIPSPSYLD